MYAARFDSRDTQFLRDILRTRPALELSHDQDPFPTCAGLRRRSGVLSYRLKWRVSVVEGRGMRKLPLWVAVAILVSIASAAAELYPSRTIKIVVPLPPGATADTLPRIIADKLALQ